MEPDIPSDIFMVIVCVAVAAEVSAGVVCADICTKNAGTFGPLGFLLRHDKVTADRRFKGLLCHAASAVHSKWCKIVSLSTGFYGYAVSLADLSESPADSDTFLRRNCTNLRKIALHLFVKVNKADNADLGMT